MTPKRALLIAFFSLLNYFASAQGKFELYPLTNNLQGHQKVLEKRVAKSATIEEAKHIVLSVITENSGTAVIRYVQKGKVYYWTHHFGKAPESVKGALIDGTRSSDQHEFYSASQSLNYFRDTIVLIDTLRFRMLLNIATYPAEKYAARLVKEGAAAVIDLPPDSQNELQLPPDAGRLGPGIHEFELFNKNRPDKTLAKCKLYELSPDESGMIRNFANGFARRHPDYDNSAVVTETSRYITAYYGHADDDILEHWLKKTGK